METHLCLYMWGVACFFVESKKNVSLVQYECICVCLNTEQMHILHDCTGFVVLGLYGKLACQKFQNAPKIP